jgi:hypothetical protein
MSKGHPSVELFERQFQRQVALNALTEGATFLGMFAPDGYYRFGRDELASFAPDWTVRVSQHDWFPAPQDTLTAFHTLVAERPAGG